MNFFAFSENLELTRVRHFEASYFCYGISAVFRLRFRLSKRSCSSELIMDRGVQEHYQTDSSQAGRKNVYKPYKDGINGKRFFQCSICLQLVYKPIVHACGHVFCFWCAYQSVNPATRSECPRCRRPYLHIPRVCKALHLLLQRIEPGEYKTRTELFQELEAQSGTFSPCLEDEPEASESFMEFLRTWYASTNESMGMSRPATTEFFDENGIHTPRYAKEGENQAGEVIDQQPPVASQEETEASDSRSTSEESLMRALESINIDTFYTPDSWDSEVGGYFKSGEVGATSDQSDLDDEFNIMIDLLCPRCEKLLYRPLVLNCGHVFCERCVAVPRGAILKCPYCERHQPGLLTQVCEELDAYLGKAFPLEYNEQVAGKHVQDFHPVNIIEAGLDICTRRHRELVAINTALVCDWFPDTRKHPQRIVENIGPALRGPLHYGIACDGCGMVPIIGPRFECLDCTVDFGFDLCETCHLSGFDLSGHINQDHTPKHRMGEWRTWTIKRGGVIGSRKSQEVRRCVALHCAREGLQEEDEGLSRHVGVMSLDPS